MKLHNSNSNHDYRKAWEKRSYWIVLGIAVAILLILAFAIVHAKAESFEQRMNHNKEVISAYEKKQQESYEEYSIWLKYNPQYDKETTTPEDYEEKNTAEEITTTETTTIIPTVEETTTGTTTIIPTVEETTTGTKNIKPKALALENKDFIAAESVEVTTEAETEPKATTETERTYNENWTYNDDSFNVLDDDEIDLLCRIVNAENGSAPDWVIQYTAQVILNRVKCSEFPDNISDVITQVDYINGRRIVQYETYWNGAADAPASQRVIDNVLSVIENGTDLPSFVIGQSMGMWDGCHLYCQYNSDDGPEYFFWWED